MINRKRFPKIFSGWWIVLTGGIIQFWISGNYSYGFAALFKPIASELGFSRAATSVPASIGRAEGGFEAPLAGWVTDKFGPRWIVLFGVFISGLSLILMNYVNSLWAFYLVWGVVLGTGHNIACSVPLDTSISNWFVKKRGLALSIKMAFQGLGGVLVLPLVAWLLTNCGWRMACVISGVALWIICLPLAWFFLKSHRPEYYGLLPDGVTTADTTANTSQTIDKGVKYAAEVEEVEFTIRQAMRTPTYWLLIAVGSIAALANPTITMHGVPFLTDIGISPVKAASMVAIFPLASLPARIIGGYFADRIRKKHLPFLIAVIYLFQAAGFGVFVLNQTIPMIYVWFILYGIGFGGSMTVLAAVKARYFGRKAFGSIQGTSAMFMSPVGIAAPVYAGWVYDTTGSYLKAFTIVAILLAIAAVASPFVRPPKPPAKITDIHKIV